MNYLHTDQYTRVNHNCPVNVQLHQVDNLVEIILGEHRFGGDALRLLVDHPETCTRLMDALAKAHNQLTIHQSSCAKSASTAPRLKSGLSDAIAG
jgi:hypothetical protein